METIIAYATIKKNNKSISIANESGILSIYKLKKQAKRYKAHEAKIIRVKIIKILK